jgi:hypothetical protein
MHGKKMLRKAGKLYAKATGLKPDEAKERADVERPKSAPELGRAQFLVLRAGDAE